MTHTSSLSSRPKTITVSAKIVKDILDEIRLMRNEITLLLPNEDLGEYDHPERIKSSLLNARKRYSAL